jgi:flagellar hook-length control protein FliK
MTQGIAPDAMAATQNQRAATALNRPAFVKPLPENEDADLKATLLALSDALQSMAPGIAPEALATTQSQSAATALNRPPFLKPLPENEDADLKATLLALSDALQSMAPGIAPEALATTQSQSAATTLNRPPFATPLPEKAKLNMLGENDTVSGDFLQKETLLRQSIQHEQGSSLQSLKDTEYAEKTLVIEKQATISGIEKTAPEVAADTVLFHKPIDNRTDSPTITRPLTHPAWSKDLGEQIVWMNNKAIPAAEIRLNPEHLGPISVRIDVNQDQATILFTAQHAEVKDAIEASLPKLREMLGSQQLNLTNVNISQNSTPDQGRSHAQTFFNTSENREQGIEDVADTIEDQVVISKGLLSLYA